MERGVGVRKAVRWALCSAALCLAGCDALDRGLLDPARPSVPGAPDSGPTDGGMLPAGGSGGSSNSGGTTGGVGGAGASGGTGGIAPTDSGMGGDGRVDESDSGPADGGAVDAGPMCGEPGVDCCPEDDDKLEPGLCGCGVSETDGDGDETPDCVDQCPIDPNKTAAGACGCGLAETEAATCTALRSALRHRYRFDGTGTKLEDSVSDADGTVMNASLDGAGTLTLAGSTSNEHVDLPDGMISALTDATFEVWLTWAGGGSWERVLDFGNSSGSTGDTYLFITPRRGNGSNNLRAAMSLAGADSEVVLDAPSALPSGSVRHIALVVSQSELRLYLDGALQGSVANTRRLSQLNDLNNWLGRSNYSVDPELGGTYHELRIYNAVLSDAQIAGSFAFGPDPAFLE